MTIAYIRELPKLPSNFFVLFVYLFNYSWCSSLYCPFCLIDEHATRFQYFYTKISTNNAKGLNICAFPISNIDLGKQSLEILFLLHQDVWLRSLPFTFKSQLILIQARKISGVIVSANISNRQFPIIAKLSLVGVSWMKETLCI